MKYLSVVVGLLVGASFLSGCGGGGSVGGGSRLLVERVTLAGDTDIYFMSPTGAVQQRVIADLKSDLSPRWSPDGSRIAFLRIGPPYDSQGLFVVNADGSSEQNIYTGTQVATEFPYDPDWLDNDTLVFRRGGMMGMGLVKRSIATGEVTVLTTPGSESFDDKTAVSPDGSKIAFIRTTILAGSSTSELYMANSDGTNAHAILTDVGHYTPAWSPDGTKLAFVRFTALSDGGDWNICVANADGSNPRLLTTSMGTEFAPVWSPDGSKIIFAAQMASGNELYQINLDRTGLRRLTTNDLGEVAYGWR